MITFYYRNLKDPELTVQDKFRTGSWIHMQTPTQDEIQQMAERFNLEEGHLRDALDPDEMPRVEHEGEATYVFLRYSFAKDGRLHTAPILFVLGPKSLLTVSAQDIPN